MDKVNTSSHETDRSRVPRSHGNANRRKTIRERKVLEPRNHLLRLHQKTLTLHL